MILLKKKSPLMIFITKNIYHVMYPTLLKLILITIFASRISFAEQSQKKKKSLISHNPFTLTLLNFFFITLLKSYIKKKKQILHPVIINVEQW